MYAVIETGGKQYRVEVGTELQVELLDVEPGKTITLERVLLVGDGDESAIGRPLVDGAAVSAEVVRQMRGEKTISFKYRPKARSRVKKGHRQELTVLRIADITFGGKSAAKVAKKAQDEARTERERLETAAAAQAVIDAELAAKLAVGAAKPAKAKTEAAPARSRTKGDAKTEAKTPAKSKADAKTETKTATKTKIDAKAAAPKRTTAKADTDAPKAKADAPKSSRATKKDE